jgi:TRAP-type C4-dicarboxylate transport system permease large subunit
MVALLAVLILIVYIPGLVLWLPDTLLGVSRDR